MRLPGYIMSVVGGAMLFLSASDTQTMERIINETLESFGFHLNETISSTSSLASISIPILQVGSESNSTTALNHTKEDAFSQNIKP